MNDWPGKTTRFPDEWLLLHEIGVLVSGLQCSISPLGRVEITGAEKHSSGDSRLNLRDMAEFAAWISANSISLIESGRRIPQEPVQEFWQHSRQRLHSWMRMLRSHDHSSDSATETDPLASWQRIEPVLAEIFVSEIITRVWSAVLTASDIVRNDNQAAPVASTVMLGHMKARHAALTAMVDGLHNSDADLKALDQLRRRSERWSDLLLGHLVHRYPVSRFAVDRRRAHEFGHEHLSTQIDDPDAAVWNLVLAGLRISYPDARSFPLPHETEHQRIQESLLATFPPDTLFVGEAFEAIAARQQARNVG